MYVSKEIRARVEAKLAACIEILEKRYNQKFKMPSIEYTGATHVAGSAMFSQWKIELSAPLLMDPANVEEMINDTTPHELAHLVTNKVYPEVSERGQMQFTSRGMRRGKREVHGPRWQEVMWAMGVNPSRTHNMKLSEDSAHADKVRQRVRYDWLCTGCNTTIQLGPKHNARMEKYGDIWHKTCHRAKLVKPGTVVETKKLGNLTIHRTTAPDTKPVRELHYPAPAALPPMQMKVPHIPEPSATDSKIDICKRLYTANRSLSRALMIQKFIDIAKCTQAGAGTYYATCKKLYG